MGFTEPLKKLGTSQRLVLPALKVPVEGIIELFFEPCKCKTFRRRHFLQTISILPDESLVIRNARALQVGHLTSVSSISSSVRFTVSGVNVGC
jgi:hypothetical protein